MKYLAYTCYASVFSALVFFRFDNMHMTETELFVEYWPVWVAAVLVVIAGAYIESLPPKH